MTEAAFHPPSDAESLTDPRVRTLLERYARLTGARLVEVAPDLLELELPLGERVYFAGETRGEVPARVRLAFSLDAIEHDPSAEMAVVGSPFFDGLVDAVRERGWSHDRGTVVPDHEPSAVAPLSVPVSNGHAEQRAVDVSRHPLGLLVARVVIRSGAETEERLVTSGVFDLTTGQSAPSTMADACERAADQRPGTGEGTTMLDGDAFLTGMMQDLEARMADVLMRWQAEADRSLETELARLDRYYDSMAAQDELRGVKDRAVLENERTRRKAEEERRHGLKASVHPVQLERWSVLAQSAKWTLVSPAGARGHVTARRFLNGGGEWELVCPRCGETPQALTVCYESHVGCHTCAALCSVCGEGFCHDHGIVTCAVDEQPACQRHSTRCPSCRREHCTAHQGVCAETDHVACTDCLAPCAVCGTIVCSTHGLASAEDAPRGPRRLCRACVVYCEGRTSEPVGRDEAVGCGSCEQWVCQDHQNACALDAHVHCSKHLRRSDHSRRLVCESHRGTCEAEAATILASDEVFRCVQCERWMCGRHSEVCVGHRERFCTEHLKPLLDTQGEFGCGEHYSMCHVDGGTFSLAGTSACPVCTKPTCRNHLVTCRSCARAVCRSDTGQERSCVTCNKLTSMADPGDDLIVASIAANGGEPLRAKSWRVARDAADRVVEVNLGWTRRIVFSVPHGESAPGSVMRHSVLGSRRG